MATVKTVKHLSAHRSFNTRDNKLLQAKVNKQKKNHRHYEHSFNGMHTCFSKIAIDIMSFENTWVNNAVSSIWFSFPVAVSNFCRFLAGKDENFSQVLPIH